MFRTTLTSAIISAFVMTGASFAQADRMLQPYGMAPDAMTTHYTPPARDNDGNRVIVNGQVIDMSGRRTAPSSQAANFSGGVAAMAPSSLRQTTLNAVAIGNMVEINGARNSTFVINQRNYGRQSASASLGGSGSPAPQPAGHTAAPAGWPHLTGQDQPAGPANNIIGQTNTGYQNAAVSGS